MDVSTPSVNRLSIKMLFVQQILAMTMETGQKDAQLHQA